MDELTRRQADYDELKNQNDLYRRFFSISDSNADYTLEPATVIAHVPDDPSGSFIINIGQSQGITSGMPVITENGLVGIVGRVSERYCRVLTLMDPAVNIGVLDSTTLDTGILTGDAAMSEDNTARLTYLRLQSEEARNAFIGRYYFLDSLKEVAAYCGMSESKCKSLLYRTRVGLKEYLEKEGFSVCLPKTFMTR